LRLREVLPILSQSGRMHLCRVFVNCLQMGFSVFPMLHGLRLWWVVRCFGLPLASEVFRVLRRGVWHLLMFDLH
jgi:hypothetical protein